MDKAVIAKALHEMKDELVDTKDEAEAAKVDLESIEPADLLNSTEEAPELETVKTPADAKKILNEAITDINNVIDGIDGFIGQAEEEEKVASVKRINAKYASSISSLSNNAAAAIVDAKQAIAHWSFLRGIKTTSGIKADNLRTAAQTLKEANSLVSMARKMFSFTKDASATPPTGAKDSGDKWPKSGDPVKSEQGDWQSGNSKFEKDKKWEDSRPNAATDTRLVEVDYVEKGAVKASLITVAGNKFGSYWKLNDRRAGKTVIASFANVPETIGVKDDKNFAIFASSTYGNSIVDAVLSDGIESTRQALAGQYLDNNGRIVAVASEPKIKDKAKNRAYYAKAYGDKAYARELTSAQRRAGLDGSVEQKANSVNIDDRIEAAKDPATPRNILETLKSDPIIEVRQAAENTLSTTSSRRYASTVKIAATLQDIKNADPRSVDDADAQMLIDLAANSSDATILSALDKKVGLDFGDYGSPNTYDIGSGIIRNLVANPATPSKIIEGIVSTLVHNFDIDSTEEIYDYVESITANPNTSPKALKLLYRIGKEIQDQTDGEDGGDIIDLVKANPNYQGGKTSSLQSRAKQMDKDKKVKKEDVKEKAKKAVKAARYYAAVGAIPFTKTAIYAKASDLLKESVYSIEQQITTLSSLPIKKQAALVEAHIPETETGIVGNKAEGVRDHLAQVDTEGISNTVEGDAKITKSASMVPQLQSNGLRNVSSMFSTTESKLQAKGIDTNKVKKANYKTF